MSHPLSREEGLTVEKLMGELVYAEAVKKTFEGLIQDFRTIAAKFQSDAQLLLDGMSQHIQVLESNFRGALANAGALESQLEDTKARLLRARGVGESDLVRYEYDVTPNGTVRSIVLASEKSK